MRLEEIPLDEIEAPNTSRKLHPSENEISIEDSGVDEDTPGTWENFVTSVNKELQKPLEVTEENGQYRLIDGDRRFRALEEGSSETAACIVKEGKDDDDVFVSMLRANEFREPSDKTRRAELIARLCQPWLLPSGERDEDTQQYQQSEMADEIGVSSATISIWLEPVREKYPLRSALSDTIGTPNRNISEERVDEVDEIRNKITGGSESGHVIAGTGQVEFVAEKISEMEGLSLSEIGTTADKAIEKGWGTKKFLEYLDEHYTYDDWQEEANKEEEDDAFEDTTEPEDSGIQPETGMMGDSDADPDDVGVGDVVNPGPEWEVPRPPGIQKTLNELDADSEFRSQRMLSTNLEDASAVTVNALAERYEMETREVMDEFVEPLVAHAAIAAESDPKAFEEVIDELKSI